MIKHTGPKLPALISESILRLVHLQGWKSWWVNAGKITYSQGLLHHCHCLLSCSLSECRNTNMWLFMLIVMWIYLINKKKSKNTNRHISWRWIQLGIYILCQYLLAISCNIQLNSTLIITPSDKHLSLSGFLMSLEVYVESAVQGAQVSWRWFNIHITCSRKTNVMMNDLKKKSHILESKSSLIFRRYFQGITQFLIYKHITAI